MAAYSLLGVLDKRWTGTVDTPAIGRERANVIELPDPRFSDSSRRRSRHSSDVLFPSQEQDRSEPGCEAKLWEARASARMLPHIGRDETNYQWRIFRRDGARG
jgi:hypothetical protein